MLVHKLRFSILLNYSYEFDETISNQRYKDNTHTSVVKQYKSISKGITYIDIHDKCSSYRYRSISILEHNMQKSRLVQFSEKTDMFFIASNNVFLFLLCEYYNLVEFNFNIWKRRRIYFRNS